MPPAGMKLWTHHIVGLIGVVLVPESCMTSFVSSVSHPQNGVTPLLIASDRGHTEIVRMLLNSGAKDIPDQVTLLLQFYFVNTF